MAGTPAVTLLSSRASMMSCGKGQVRQACRASQRAVSRPVGPLGSRESDGGVGGSRLLGCTTDRLFAVTCREKLTLEQGTITYALKEACGLLGACTGKREEGAVLASGRFFHEL